MFLLNLILWLVGLGHAQYGHHGPALLPDPRFTPGEVETTDKRVVCSESTKWIRKPGIEEVYLIYDVKKIKGTCCEIDHLVSLELGGANSVNNEWPQPYLPRPGAHEKDVVENWLHRQVCTGKMDLKDAQKRISSDWYQVYLDMKGHS